MFYSLATEDKRRKYESSSLVVNLDTVHVMLVSKCDVHYPSSRLRVSKLGVGELLSIAV